MAADKFLRGAMVLTAAGLLVKILGSVNRILLSRFLGGEGIGLYQIAYPVFLLVLAVSSAGVPIAISILVAEKVAKGQYAAARHTFKISLGIMLAMGSIFAILLYFVAGWMINTGIVKDSRAYLAIISLVPAVILSSVLASFRGYFQGFQMMQPTAVSQIFEQFVRVMTMIGLAYYLLPYGLEYAAAGAAFGAVPGAVAGLIVLSYFYCRNRRAWEQKTLLVEQDRPEKVRQIAKRMLLLALPVTCANIMVPASNILDMLLVPNCLYSIGYSVEQSTTLYGYLTGMGLPLVLMSTIVTLSLETGIVPAISEAYTLGDTKAIADKARMAMNICCLLTFPAMVGLFVLAEPIAKMIYNVAQAGVIIRHLSVVACLIGVYQVSTGILQGLGKINVPMVNMFIGLTAKSVAILLLVVEPYNVLGAAWATDLNLLLAAGLNLLSIKKMGITFVWGKLLRMFVAALTMGFVATVLYPVLTVRLGNTLAVCLTILVAGCVYAAMLLVVKAVDKELLIGLPIIGKRLERLVRK